MAPGVVVQWLRDTVAVLGGACLDWMCPEAFSTDDPKPNALLFSPDGSSSLRFCSVFITRGGGRFVVGEVGRGRVF